MNIVYLNSQYVEAEQAQVSVFDRGFLFGDGIYEVITVYEHCLFCVEQHLARLRKSLEKTNISLSLSNDDIIDILQTLVKKNKKQNCSLYLQITRGAENARSHAASPNLTPTIFMCVQPYKNTVDMDKGMTAVLEQDIRWSRCDIKAITLLANTMMYSTAREHDIDDVILVRDGFVTEGVMSNIFVVKNQIIYTSPADQFILGGITRDVIIEIARQHHLPLIERPITVDELFTADEVWTTNSTREVAPVTKINEKLIGHGKPGPMLRQMHSLFQQYKQAYIAKQQEHVNA